MQPIPNPNVAASGGGYIPYFYQAGLFQFYEKPSDVRPSRPRLDSLTGPGSAADRSFHDRLDNTQTVEQIITHGYFAISPGDPVTAIISDKQQTSRLGLDDVISQIRHRHEIYQDNLYQIELGKCAAMNSLYGHEAYSGPPTDKQFYARHKRLQELYVEQREERTSLWKDVSRLRLALPESAQQYLAAYRKMAALTDVTGDAP